MSENAGPWPVELLRDVERLTEERVGWERLTAQQERVDELQALLLSLYEDLDKAGRLRFRKDGSSWRYAGTAWLRAAVAAREAHKAITRAHSATPAAGAPFASELALAQAHHNLALLQLGMSQGALRDAARRADQGRLRSAEQAARMARLDAFVGDLARSKGSAARIAEDHAGDVGLSVERLTLLIRRERQRLRPTHAPVTDTMP